MVDSTTLMIVVICGAAASLVYFGGLWLTVNQLSRASNPAFLLLVSFILRAGPLVCGAMVLLQMGLEFLLSGFAGFLVVRYLLTRTVSSFTTGLTSTNASQP